MRGAVDEERQNRPSMDLAQSYLFPVRSVHRLFNFIEGKGGRIVSDKIWIALGYIVFWIGAWIFIGVNKNHPDLEGAILSVIAMGLFAILAMFLFTIGNAYGDS